MSGWLAAVGGAAAFGLLGIVALVGFGATRPKDHVATVSRTVAAPPDAVWALVAGFDTQARWRTDRRAVSRRGDRIEETDRWGKVQAFRIVEEVPGERLVTEVIEQTAFSGTWTITLAPEAGGTRVTVVERGTVHSAVLRAVGALLFDPAATATAYLAGLDAALAARDGAPTLP